jgi:regulator of replication initiation timing
MAWTKEELSDKLYTIRAALGYNKSWKIEQTAKVAEQLFAENETLRKENAELRKQRREMWPKKYARRLIKMWAKAMNERDALKNRVCEIEDAAMNAIDYVGMANYAHRIIEAKQMVHEAVKGGGKVEVSE